MHIRQNRRNPSYSCPLTSTACFPSHLRLVVGVPGALGQVFCLGYFVEVGKVRQVVRVLVAVAVEDLLLSRCSCLTSVLAPRYSGHSSQIDVSRFRALGVRSGNLQLCLQVCFLVFGEVAVFDCLLVVMAGSVLILSQSRSVNLLSCCCCLTKIEKIQANLNRPRKRNSRLTWSSKALTLLLRDGAVLPLLTSCS